MTDETTLEFDLVLKQIPVKLKQKDGSVRSCALLELSGELRDEYMEDMQTYMSGEDEDGVPKVKKVKGLNTLLLTKCLHDVDAKGELVSLVPAEDIKGFPVTVLEKLIVAAKKISGLRQPVKNPQTGKWEMPSEEDAKNDSSEANPKSGSN